MEYSRRYKLRFGGPLGCQDFPAFFRGSLKTSKHFPNNARCMKDGNVATQTPHLNKDADEKENKGGWGCIRNTESFF